MVKEGVDSGKECTYDEELQSVGEDHVDHEDEHQAFLTATVRSPLAADHVHAIADDLFRAKESTIHPATPLLHQGHQVGRRIRKGLGIRDVGELETAMDLCVDLEAHDPVLSQVLISFGTCWCLSTSHILEEGIERPTFNRVPAED